MMIFDDTTVVAETEDSLRFRCEFCATEWWQEAPETPKRTVLLVGAAFCTHECLEAWQKDTDVGVPDDGRPS